MNVWTVSYAVAIVGLAVVAVVNRCRLVRWSMRRVGASPSDSRVRREARGTWMVVPAALGLAAFALVGPAGGEDPGDEGTWGFLLGGAIIVLISYVQFLARTGDVGHEDGDDGARL